MSKLKLMKTFMLTVEEGSIVQAAKILGITKAAASKHVIDLENQLKTQLLQRTTRAQQLTEAGRRYYESIKKVFSALSEAESTLLETQQKPIGMLRITSHRYFGEKYIVNNLQEFSQIYPDLTLDLELAERFPDLEKENIDILFGIGYEGPDNLVRKKIATAHHILCASPEYLEKWGRPATPDELKQHRYITHSIRNPNNILEFHGKKQVSVKPYIRLNDAQAMLKCAVQGLGIVKLHTYLVDDYLRNGKLIEILKDFREPKKSIYVFYQQHKFIQSKVRFFLDFIYRKMRSDSI